MKSKLTEEEILEGLRGDMAAQDRVIKICFVDDPEPLNQFKRLVVGNSGSLEDAEEIFDDAIIDLIAKLNKPDFKLQTSLFPYLYGIARNKWLKLLEKKKRMPLTQLDFDLLETPPEDHEAKEALQELVDFGLSKLEDKQREILLAKYADKKSMKEIAAEFGLANEDRAKNYVARYRGYLLEHMKKHPRYTQITQKDK